MTKVDHGFDHGRPWSYDHGSSWSTLVVHGRPWSVSPGEAASGHDSDFVSFESVL